MSDAPERIWIDWSTHKKQSVDNWNIHAKRFGRYSDGKLTPHDIEYTLTSLADKQRQDMEDELFKTQKDLIGARNNSVAMCIQARQKVVRPILAALFAALRWISPEYRNHINNDGAYQIMMNDVSVGQSYKDDIKAIRETIKLAEGGK